jgi:hypothetical protein
VTFTPETARAAGRRSVARRRSRPDGNDRLTKHLRELVDHARTALRAHRRGGAIVAALADVEQALRRAHARLILDHLNGGAP